MTTDNARDEEPLAWCPGCGDRIPTEVIRERGVCSNCYGTSDDPWAGGRTEMTTDEDEVHPSGVSFRWEGSLGDTPTTAQQALAEAWAEGHRTGWEHCQDGNYGNDHWDDPTPTPYAAAGRPSVTDNARPETGWIEWAQNLTGAYVTTTEEARQQIEGLVSGLTELAGLTSRAAGRAETTTDEECGDYPAPCNCDDPDTHDGATTKTTTATTEDAARVINEVLGGDMDNHARIAAHRLADAGLLAAARTRPTREQIDRAVGEVLLNAANHPDPVAVLGRSIAPLRTKITHAVLDLLRDGAR